MNSFERELLSVVADGPKRSQRSLAEVTGRSLGSVNRALSSLVEGGYLDEGHAVTKRGLDELASCAPRNAIILAAGIGMRMAPINFMHPKGMMEVHGEPLVERLVRQLKAVGVDDITIVVGFMKERFDYLIDEYGVRLVVSREYATKNNLHSLALVAERISNTYIVPSDVWAASNPFRRFEPYSWYMVSDQRDEESMVRIMRDGSLVPTRRGEGGNHMVGIAYLLEEEARELGGRIDAMVRDASFDDAFWEDALFGTHEKGVMARLSSPCGVVEIDTYEQLRDLDEGSAQLKSDAIEVIAASLGVSPSKVTGIEVLKKGMTNRSFLFSVDGQKYIMRIPGEGTDQLIERKQEAEVYRAIARRGLCDDPVYINPENGYKITRFLEGARTCDPESIDDLRRCMKRLREFHGMRLQVPHAFDIVERTDFYESLWAGRKSEYRDYEQTKEGVLSLRPFVDSLPHEWCLTHIDAVPDNFLFYDCGQEGEGLQLVDWEYAGMQDPHVDIAMFAIYAMYDKERTDRLIDLYFEEEGGCSDVVRAKIYCYMAMCGLLWSNWCEYKRNLGVEFGEYSLAQYRYAKDYRRHAIELVPEIGAMQA